VIGQNTLLTPTPPASSRTRRTSSGFILVVVLVIASVLAVFASCLMHSVSHAGTFARRAQTHTQARLLAEAAVEKARFELSRGNLAYRGESATQFGNGELSVTVRPVDGQKNERQVVARGIFPSRGAIRSQRTLTILLRRAGKDWSIERWINDTRE